ncbi:hypothetical protein [Paenibacillus ginsengarvi]|uniref:Uncharacterized protein n=1 Tax=Paenibacillus ginsengarvi TaxID=400777 RepID=A0A3B0AXR7_9BACL|nr:hypothetical protein [Paenibacillus ginsengarvi]RKN64597.1 hypothetical protein D7M11_33675 [Paenibacillus ginsengarvi]
MAENAKKRDGHRKLFLKETEAYKPTVVPTAFKVLSGNNGNVQNYITGEGQQVEYQSERRGSYHLAGIRHGTDFPGWDGKPNWLNQKFKDFHQRISGISGFHKIQSILSIT